MTNINEYIAQSKEKRLMINQKHLENGVIFIDAETAYIDETVIIGKDTVIYPNVVLQGNTVIGQGCVIGMSTRIADSDIADQVDIQNSVITESTVGKRTKVGPFAYLRPGSKIGKDCKVGDFVEVKNSTLGDGSKSSHLAYIGDSDVGSGVNIGCGVVFVNYDGTNKYRSKVGDGAFIGCNTNLVSPVNVGQGAYIAAGSTVTKDIPDDALCVAREREVIKTGWASQSGLLKKKK